jgi:hypothetical protein
MELIHWRLLMCLIEFDGFIGCQFVELIFGCVAKWLEVAVPRPTTIPLHDKLYIESFPVEHAQSDPRVALHIFWLILIG